MLVGRLHWPQLLKVDLFRSVPGLELQVFFMEGRFDREAPSDIAAEYLAQLGAPAKELIWFERSAHMPNTEERERFNRIMLKKVLPVAGGGRRAVRSPA